MKNIQNERQAQSHCKPWKSSNSSVGRHKSDYCTGVWVGEMFPSRHVLLISGLWNPKLEIAIFLIWKLKAIMSNLNVYTCIRRFHSIWPSFFTLTTPQSTVPASVKTGRGMFFLDVYFPPDPALLYKRQQPLFLPRLLACSAALVAISNTSLTPSFVLAEHSK